MMIGFEIAVNEEEPVRAAADGVLSVNILVGYGDRDDSVHIGGRGNGGYRFEWGDRKIGIGDKIRIDVADIRCPTPPSATVPIDRKELLERYCRLRKELEEQGVEL